MHNDALPRGGYTPSPAQDVHVESRLRQMLTDVQSMVSFRRRIWGIHRDYEYPHLTDRMRERLRSTFPAVRWKKGTLVPVESRLRSLAFMKDREDERPNRDEP